MTVSYLMMTERVLVLGGPTNRAAQGMGALLKIKLRWNVYAVMNGCTMTKRSTIVIFIVYIGCGWESLGYMQCLSDGWELESWTWVIYADMTCQLFFYTFIRKLILPNTSTVVGLTCKQKLWHTFTKLKIFEFMI